jgi:hypothetical protein
MTRRLLSLLVFTAGLAAGTGAWAQDRPGLYLDPQQLPPDTRPGECVTRRVTGPGGAYRWDRVECADHAGWSDFDRWGYGRSPLQVQDGYPEGSLRGDRYGGWSRGYDRQPGEGRYGEDYRTYRVAGRDADGYLVWPGKRP